MPEILEANARDLEAGRESGLSAALMDRLALDEARVRAIADGTRAIAALPDPVGEVVDGGRLANGLEFRKVRVPLGVIAVVYEARPNVTIDAAALCLKSGNAVLLRGSSSRRALERRAGADRPRGGRGRGPARGLRWRWSPAAAARSSTELAQLEGIVDLIIPRGGEGLKKAISAVARVPVIYAAAGNCHVYVDASADLDDGRADHRQRQGPAARACATRPRRCSCTPPSRPSSCPRALAALRERGVELRGDERVRAIDPSVAAASESDWAEEFLALILAVRVVDSVRGRDRPRQPVRLRALRGDRDQRPRRRRAPSSSASTRPASTSTPRRASPTAASSGWARRSATRPRSCTRAARSACASSARRATWSTATARSAA